MSTISTPANVSDRRIAIAQTELQRRLIIFDDESLQIRRRNGFAMPGIRSPCGHARVVEYVSDALAGSASTRPAKTSVPELPRQGMGAKICPMRPR